MSVETYARGCLVTLGGILAVFVVLVVVLTSMSTPAVQVAEVAEPDHVAWLAVTNKPAYVARCGKPPEHHGFGTSFSYLKGSGGYIQVRLGLHDPDSMKDLQCERVTAMSGELCYTTLCGFVAKDRFGANVLNAVWLHYKDGGVVEGRIL